MSLLDLPADGAGGQQPLPAAVSGALPQPAATDQLIDQLLDRVEVPATGAAPAYPAALPPFAQAGGGGMQGPPFAYQMLPGMTGGADQLDPLVQELQQRRPLPPGAAMPAPVAPLPPGMHWPGTLRCRGTACADAISTTSAWRRVGNTSNADSAERLADHRESRQLLP